MLHKNIQVLRAPTSEFIEDVPPSLTGTKKDAMIFITFCIRIHNSIAALAEMRCIGRQMLSKSGVL